MLIRLMCIFILLRCNGFYVDCNYNVFCLVHCL